MAKSFNIPPKYRIGLVALAAGTVLSAGCTNTGNTNNVPASKDSTTTTESLAQVGAPGLMSIEKLDDGTFKGVCEKGEGHTIEVAATDIDALNLLCPGR